KDLDTQLASPRSVLLPFGMLAITDDLEVHLRCARKFLPAESWPRAPAIVPTASRQHQRIRVAYLSADFRRHVIGHQIVELIEKHDRSRFETVGISFGPDDGSDLRNRIVRAFEHFHDVSGMSDRNVAEFLRERAVDIAIDLMGCTELGRPGIFAHRAAPIQVSYIGYLGSMGTDFIDYVIADGIALPIEQQPFYSEKIVHLPNSFLVNDSKSPIAVRTPSRGEAGLPNDAFVFCCFNNSWKINAEI